MADCAIYEQQLNKILDNKLLPLQMEYNTYNQQLRSPNITSIQIGNILREVKNVFGTLSTVSRDLKALNNQAANAGCTEIAREAVKLDTQLGGLQQEVYILEQSIPKLLEKVKVQFCCTEFIR